MDCAPPGCSPVPVRRPPGWIDPHRRRAGARWKAADHSGPGCAVAGMEPPSVRGEASRSDRGHGPEPVHRPECLIRITARGRVERRLVHEEATAEGSPSPGAVPITRRSTRWSPVTVSGSSVGRAGPRRILRRRAPPSPGPGPRQPGGREPRAGRCGLPRCRWLLRSRDGERRLEASNRLVEPVRPRGWRRARDRLLRRPRDSLISGKP